MFKKVSFLLLIVFTLVAPINIYAATNNSTTGFISGDIWYSKAKLVEGDDVKIYTGFWNGENAPVNIKVSFFDKETLLGDREVVVPALTLRDVSISWKVTSGDHQIRALVTKATSNANGTNEDVVLVNSEVKNGSMFIPKKIDSELGADKLEELGEKVIDALPENVSEPIALSVSEIDLFRQKTEVSIQNGIQEAKEKIGEIDNKEENITSSGDTKKEDAENSNNSKKDSLDGTEKPIAYIQLFLLTVASFIFSNSLLFYGLIIVFIFLILRFIFNKIRGR